MAILYICAHIAHLTQVTEREEERNRAQLVAKVTGLQDAEPDEGGLMNEEEVQRIIGAFNSFARTGDPL
jgi:hypothetical protein